MHCIFRIDNNLFQTDQNVLFYTLPLYHGYAVWISRIQVPDESEID